MTDSEHTSLHYPKIKDFAESGFLVIESLFTANDYQSHLEELDRYSNYHLDFHACASNPELVRVLQNERLHQTLGKIFGQSSYSLHHISSIIHSGSNPSLAWHHDKVPLYSPPSPSHGEMMVHVLYYPNGISADVGELLLVPKSHTWRVDRYQLSSVPLESIESISINSLAPGSIVIINSSLIHGRRSKHSSARTQKKRYLVDLSFCSSVAKWEPYLESNHDFRETFALLKSTINTQHSPTTTLDYLNLKPFLPHKIFSILPWKVAKPIYKLLSFYSRRFLYPIQGSRKTVEP